VALVLACLCARSAHAVRAEGLNEPRPSGSGGPRPPSSANRSLAPGVVAARQKSCPARPPMPWLKDPIASPLPLRACAESPLRKACVTQAIFAAGFGGHVAGAVIRSGQGSAARDQ
jgi:hypothetical protein